MFNLLFQPALVTSLVTVIAQGAGLSSAAADPLPHAFRMPDAPPVLMAGDNPAFDRLVALCDDLGIDCPMPSRVYADRWKAVRQDAEKRLAIVV